MGFSGTPQIGIVKMNHEMCRNFIIITSIFHPTEAVRSYSNLKNFKTIVIGDKKSPEIFYDSMVIYLSVEDQKDLSFNLQSLLPYNHYCRKNLGYIYAIKNGAELIIDTDDDNIPYPGWNFPAFSGKFDCIPADMGFVNIYHFFTDKEIWPRGFPLNKILSQKNIQNEISLSSEDSNIGIWQGLADNDPDVDAVYRLIFDTPLIFNKRTPINLKKGTVAPFNSQNTAFRRELFPLLYLPSTVTFRFTDILRGLVAQPIMWLYNYTLGFTRATVTQFRNPHDYMKDFESEIPCFMQSERIIEIVSRKINISYSITENLFLSYESLCRHGIVKEEELAGVEAWIKDIA
jgi:hypothetical protein